MANPINQTPSINAAFQAEHTARAHQKKVTAIVLAVLAIGLVAAGGAVLGPQLAGHLGNVNWINAGTGIGTAVLGLGVVALAIHNATKASHRYEEVDYKRLAKIVKSDATVTLRLNDRDFNQLQEMQEDRELQRVLAQDDRMTGDRLLDGYENNRVSVDHLSFEQFSDVVERAIQSRKEVVAILQLRELSNEKLDVLYNKISSLSGELAPVLSDCEIKGFACHPEYLLSQLKSNHGSILSYKNEIYSQMTDEAKQVIDALHADKIDKRAVVKAAFKIGNDFEVFARANPEMSDLIEAVVMGVGNAVNQKAGRELMFQLHQLEARSIKKGDIDLLVKWFQTASFDEAVEFLKLLPSESEVTQAIISQSLDKLKSLQQQGDEGKVIEQLARYPKMMINALLVKPKAQFSSEDFELMYAVFEAITPENIEKNKLQELSDDVKKHLEKWDVKKTFSKSNATLKGLVEGLKQAHETRKSKKLKVVDEPLSMPLIIKKALDDSTKKV